jgi:hypothetical protein
MGMYFLAFLVSLLLQVSITTYISSFAYFAKCASFSPVLLRLWLRKSLPLSII